MKKTAASTILVAWLGLCGITSLLASRPALAGSPVKFKLARGYLIVIPVTVNGVGPDDFLLDTGTNTTILSLEFARQLGLRPMDRVSLVTVTGAQAVPRSRIERLTCGPQTAADLEVLCTDLREVRAVDGRIRGVLGQNFLSQFNYLLNYRDRSLEFEERGELENRSRGTRLPFGLAEGQMVVAAQSSRRTWRLILDSAVTSPLLFGAPGRGFELDLERVENSSMMAATDLGSSLLWAGRLRWLQLGSEIFYDLPVTLTPHPAAGRAADGLLPTSLFRSLYVNHQQRFVALNPR